LQIQISAIGQTISDDDDLIPIWCQYQYPASIETSFSVTGLNDGKAGVAAVMLIIADM
jgi:hypothetical protein